MSYEIQQQLQYEEKIIFGLTFKQLLYAVIFGVPCLIIFFKTKMGIVPKSCIAALLMGTASLFMFFDFSGYIKNMVYWFKFRDVSLMDAKMIQFIGIEKIENGVVYVNKAKKPVVKRKAAK